MRCLSCGGKDRATTPAVFYPAIRRPGPSSPRDRRQRVKVAATWTTHEIAGCLDCRPRWIQKLAQRAGVGTRVGKGKVFTWPEVLEILRRYEASQVGRPRKVEIKQS